MKVPISVMHRIMIRIIVYLERIPVCSRSRGDVDGEGHSKYCLVKTGIHHKFEKIHNGADLKDLGMIAYSKARSRK